MTFILKTIKPELQHYNQIVAMSFTITMERSDFDAGRRKQNVTIFVLS